MRLWFCRAAVSCSVIFRLLLCSDALVSSNDNLDRGNELEENDLMTLSEDWLDDLQSVEEERKSLGNSVPEYFHAVKNHTKKVHQRKKKRHKDATKVRIQFNYHHLTKAGGTFTKHALRKVLPDDHFSFTGDDTPAKWFAKSEGNSATDFHVISMRNPCSLYVSFAHFNPGKAFNYGQGTAGTYRRCTPSCVKSYSLSGLEKYIQDARCASDGTGFYSYYFWTMLIAPECFMWHKWMLKGKGDPSLAPRCNDSSLMRKELHEFDPAKADCWIFQETMIQDMRKCLVLYEQKSSFTRGSVDWDAFEAIANGTDTFPELGVGFVKTKGLNQTGMRHKSCQEYASDGRLEETVRASDPELFQKFGYGSCCHRSNFQHGLSMVA